MLPKLILILTNILVSLMPENQAISINFHYEHRVAESHTFVMLSDFLLFANQYLSTLCEGNCFIAAVN